MFKSGKVNNIKILNGDRILVCAILDGHDLNYSVWGPTARGRCECVEYVSGWGITGVT